MFQNLFFLLSIILFCGEAFADAGQLETRLFEGNHRFIQKATAADRLKWAEGQHPIATVLACSDSRVAPEIIFDQKLGDVFVVRVAGNVIDPVTLGSIEYGVVHLKTPLLIILGHQSCGAVKATLEALSSEHRGKHSENIKDLVKRIVPAAKVVLAKKSGVSAETIDETVQENIRQAYKDVLKSPDIQNALDGKSLKIVLAEYYLDSGKITQITSSR